VKVGTPPTSEIEPALAACVVASVASAIAASTVSPRAHPTGLRDRVACMLFLLFAEPERAADLSRVAHATLTGPDRISPRCAATPRSCPSGRAWQAGVSTLAAAGNNGRRRERDG